MSHTQPYSSAFPDFDNGGDFETLLERLSPFGFSDASWKNDACPSLMAEVEPNTVSRAAVHIWVDYADPSLREISGDAFDMPGYLAIVDCIDIDETRSGEVVCLSVADTVTAARDHLLAARCDLPQICLARSTALLPSEDAPTGPRWRALCFTPPGISPGPALESQPAILDYGPQAGAARFRVTLDGTHWISDSFEILQIRLAHWHEARFPHSHYSFPAPSLASALRFCEEENDLDLACRAVQSALGVNDGGLAGLVFSDLPDPGANESWDRLGAGQRRDRMISYIASEAAHAPHARAARSRATTSPSAPLSADPAGFDAFRATRREMSAKAFGKAIGESMWEEDFDTRFLVYADLWYIEICDDGRYMLLLEDQSWITGQDGTLEDLERKLYAHSLGS